MNKLSIFKKLVAKDESKAEVALERLVYLARQAIFDQNLNVFGYELLYRNSDRNYAEVIDPNAATSTLIINSFVEIGLDKIVNNKLAFINLTRDYIVGELPIPFENHQVVLEILEDVEADFESVLGLKNLSEAGFQIALDDFVISEKNLDLIQYAQIIKVDVLDIDDAELERQVSMLKKYPVTLLAEKVETNERFIQCKDLGFTYFQGYFFERPKIIQGKELPVNNIQLLVLLAKLQDKDCGLHELEEIVANDVSISYKLLRIINSSYYAQVTKVSSIKGALVVLGMDALKKWIAVLSLSKLEGHPDELTRLSLIRAKMCSQLSSNFSVDEGAAFTLGLFSLLDVLMKQPIEKILEKLPLDDDLAQALVHSNGVYGELLKTVKAYEKGEWGEISNQVKDSTDFSKVYVEAVSWADQFL